MLSTEQRAAIRETIDFHYANHAEQSRRASDAATAAQRDMADQLARWHSLEADRLLSKLHADLADLIARCAS